MKYLPPHDSTDCGPACLRMIASHFGKDYSSYYMRTLTSLNRQGVSIQALKTTAETIGFKTLVGQLSLKYLVEKAQLPCILYWDKSHFVILSTISQKKKWFSDKPTFVFHILDPGVGKVKLDQETFTKYWLDTNAKGYALFLEPTPEFYSRPPETDHNRQGSLRSAFQFLSAYFARYRKNYAQVVVTMLVTVVVAMLFPFLTQGIVDYGIGSHDMGFIVLVLLFQLGLFVTNTITDVIKSHLLLHIGARINISILADFLVKLMKLPMHFFDSKMSGDLVQRIHDHQRIEDFITSTLLTTFFSVVHLLVFASVLLSYNGYVFGVFVVGSSLSVSWTLLFMRWRKSLDYKRFREMANTNEKLFEMIQAMPEIKLNSLERFKQLEWQQIQVRLFQLDISSLSLGQYQRIGADFFDQLKNIAITFICAWQVMEGHMSLGMMLAVSYMIGQLTIPVKHLIGFANTYQTTKIGIERMNEVYAEENEEKENALPFATQTVPTQQQAGIELKNLSFQYGGAESAWVLKNIHAYIPKGKITAIVGSSGSGKTTLLKLLLKFYTPTTGSICLNGRSLEMYSTQQWREECGTVMQEGHIFSDTIRRNICMGDETEQPEKLAQAIEAANISDFILDLPLHVETRIGDTGLALSTGQKQRILIARAVYKNPSYLFFDEATSALDSENERIIMDNLHTFFQGKTVVVIAHRLSTVKNADQILVLEKGELLETGTHQELIQKKERYFNLISNQLELAL